MAISQEGMEACQKRNNTFMRCINGFANAGRRPWRVVQQGREAVRSYMEARAKNKKSPEQVLWWKNLFAYVAGYSEVYERVEAHKREGRTCKWAGAFGPAWDSFWAISTFRTIIVARWRRNWLHAGGGVPVPPRHVEWRRREPRLDRSIDTDMLGCRFQVAVTGLYGECLAEELCSYYAPLPCEDHFAVDLENSARRKIIQRERRKRWAKRNRAEWWQPHPSYTCGHDTRLDL